MSKRQLIKFSEGLNKAELKEQLFDLYDRFKNVKQFYDFSFNPNEEKRSADAKLRIAKEYFPEGNRKAKKRRSVAQKLIVELLKLEADPLVIADLMLYNIEIAQTYIEDFPINQEAFYKSMLSSFRKALVFIDNQFITQDFANRIETIIEKTYSQEWMNKEGFAIAKKELLVKH